MSAVLTHNGPRVAFCYVTDGNDDYEMRTWSMHALRMYCGDVDVFTAAPPTYSSKIPGERVVDITPAFSYVYGSTDVRRKCRGSGFPVIVFGKFALPFVSEFSGYDKIITLESDIEVVNRDFRDIVDIELPNGTDVGMVARSGGSTTSSIAASYPDLALPRLTYYSAGIVIMRVNSDVPDYLDRVREMLRVSDARRFAYPEETAANMFLRIYPIPGKYHVIPDIAGAGAGGAKEIDDALSLHYGGLRKRRIRDRWKHQYESGGTIDLNDITGDKTKKEN